MLGVTAAVVATARLAGPGDLWDQDQPKTVAYTADVVLHGRWVLPRENAGRPDHAASAQAATKPPMYNWIGAMAVHLTGRWDEWVLKFPSLLATGAVVWVVVVAGRRLAGRAEVGRGVSDVSFAGVAAACWLTCYATMKLMYLARPDMVLVAFLTVGWWCGTRLLGSDEGVEASPGGRGGARRAGALSVLFWLCVTGAALAKGPPAAMLLVYIALGAKLIGGSWRAIGRTGWWWGLPAALALIGAWLVAVHRTDPNHITEVFLGVEMVDRVAAGGEGGFDFGRFLVDPWKMVLYFLAMFGPWSAFAILGMIDLGRRMWRHPLGPASLWVLIVIGFGLVGVIALDRQRADYLAPAYPAGALLAAYWLLDVGAKYRITPVKVALAALLVALGLAVYQVGYSRAAREPYGANLQQFVRDVRRHVKPDQTLWFVHTGYNPLPTLLGRHQSGEADIAPPPPEGWILRPVAEAPHAAPVAVSRPISEVVDGQPAVLGLYRMGEAGPVGGAPGVSPAEPVGGAR